jgi:hypothetical protein
MKASIAAGDVAAPVTLPVGIVGPGGFEAIVAPERHPTASTNPMINFLTRLSTWVLQRT